jgi:cyclopropane-fatty-acyl-phospholipid synthase
MPLDSTRPSLLNGESFQLRAETARDGTTPFDRWLATRVQRIIEPVDVRLELWDGTSPFARSQPAIGDIVVGDRRALIGLVVDPELYFGEAYMAGRLDVRGPFEPVIEALSRSSSPRGSWQERIRRALALPNTLRRARHNIHHHYDLGNWFYQQWLDDELVYTCAYYAVPEMTLNEAQRAKMDLVCRKLRLQPGMTVVEAGCGWGALALHMARHYGVRVRAFNVSKEQLAYARERAQREGLSSSVEFVDDDYRNIRGEYDVFVSVGMLEHVGLHSYRALAEVIRRCLRRDRGRGLLHFIGRDSPRLLNAWVRKRIFPGAYPPSLAEVTSRVLEPAGLTVVDVENLRLHYARTLAAWRDRYEASVEKVRGQYGPVFERAWRLYLAGSQAAFATGWMQLFQIVFTPLESRPPYWTRSDAMLDREGRPWFTATR